MATSMQRALAIPAIRPHVAVAASWWAAIGLSAGLLLFHLSLVPWTSLWDRDEPRFARAAVEMVESGQYLYPTFNGDLRPQKPILIYWLMTLSVRALGPTELAARFWSPVGLALAALFTYAIGRRLYSARVGLLAMAIVAFNPLAMLEAGAATTDVALLACMTGAMAAGAASLVGGVTMMRTVGLTDSLAAAQLVKGPIGLAVPLLAIAGAL